LFYNHHEYVIARSVFGDDAISTFAILEIVVEAASAKILPRSDKKACHCE
jgi:hypothetical protein